MIVEICQSNEMALHTTELEQKSIDVVTYSCLDRCAVCVRRAYAFVDGEMLEAESARELLDAIIRRKQDEVVPW